MQNEDDMTMEELFYMVGSGLVRDYLEWHPRTGEKSLIKSLLQTQHFLPRRSHLARITAERIVRDVFLETGRKLKLLSMPEQGQVSPVTPQV